MIQGSACLTTTTLVASLCIQDAVGITERLVRLDILDAIKRCRIQRADGLKVRVHANRRGTFCLLC